MNKISLFFIILSCLPFFSYGQWVDNGNKMTTSDVLELTKPILTSSEIEIRDKVFGKGSDKTVFFRDDLKNDNTYLKLQLGDENRGIFDIGYLRYQDSIWVSTFILNNGSVGIGKADPTNKLDVNGTIHSREVKVDRENWADYVFKEDYELKNLTEVEKFIRENGHLEDIPSEKEVQKNGVKLGEMNARLLQKIEELTLYIIDQRKTIEDLNVRVTQLENK
ncbi:hypothetical protein [Zunongwangia sp.]|uniref:hypothetical protein n=1 Tax=Zunongwangia sp. TaxID=1965325 RepID=UPI003AA9C21C